MSYSKKFILIFFILINFLSNSSKTFAQSIVDGIEYTRSNVKDPCRACVHIVEVDPTKVSIGVTGECMKLQKTSLMAKEAGAVVAVNGGFYHANGIPAGVLKISDNWFSDSGPKRRGAIGWNKNGQVLLDILQVSFKLQIGDDIYPVTRVNQLRRDDSAILYTPVFNDATLTSSDEGSIEIIISEKQVIDVIKRKEHSFIPKNGYVYSVGKDCNVDISKIEIGMPVKLIINYLSGDDYQKELWGEMEHIVGGAPLLVKNGNIVTDFSEEKILQSFIDKSYPRTAVGILPNGNWLFVVVDSKGIPGNNGISLPNLAKLMHKLGCLYALNLGGGYSSTLVINNKVINFSYGLASFLNLIGIKLETVVSDAFIIST